MTTMNIHKLIWSGICAEKFRAEVETALKGALYRAGVRENRAWEALLLSRQMISFKWDENGRDQYAAESGTIEWVEFRATCPERVTNRDTAFETVAQRGEGRSVRVTVKGSGKRVYAVDGGIPLPADLRFFAEGREVPWVAEVEFGDWTQGVMVDGYFTPSKDPVVVSNWALPTVGERVTV